MFENMQGFFESGTGKALVIAVIVILFILILLPGRKKTSKKPDVMQMTVSAILVALSFVLSLVTLFRMPFGGSVTALSMLPIALCAYLLGTKQGIIAGVALGLVNLVSGPYVIHPLQLLIDYPLAFGALGIGGIMRNKAHGLTKTYIVGIIGRYFFAVLSGIVFFASYAPENMNPLVYSLVYNILYIGAEGIITIIIINLPPVARLVENIKSNLESRTV